MLYEINPFPPIFNLLSCGAGTQFVAPHSSPLPPLTIPLYWFAIRYPYFGICILRPNIYSKLSI